MDGHPRLQLVLEFDQGLLEAVLNHPRLGPLAWKDFMDRLLDHNIVAPVWSARTAPPPVVVFVRAKAGALLESLGRDHFPLDVEGREESEPDLPPRCELVEVPQVSIRVSPVRCDLVFDKT
jgi:hypothetical protein